MLLGFGAHQEKVGHWTSPFRLLYFLGTIQGTVSPSTPVYYDVYVLEPGNQVLHTLKPRAKLKFLSFKLSVSDMLSEPWESWSMHSLKIQPTQNYSLSDFIILKRFFFTFMILLICICEWSLNVHVYHRSCPCSSDLYSQQSIILLIFHRCFNTEHIKFSSKYIML